MLTTHRFVFYRHGNCSFLISLNNPNSWLCCNMIITQQNRIDYNAIIGKDTTRHDTIQYDPTRPDPAQRNAIQSNPVQSSPQQRIAQTQFKRKSAFEHAQNITKTCLYIFYSLKPHFYIVKLGFTGVYIMFLISAQKHRLWVLVRTASARRF